MAKVQVDILHARNTQGLHHQADNLDIAVDTGMPVKLRTDLQRTA